MQILLHEFNLKLGDKQKDYVNEKVEHLKKYDERVGDESTQVRVDVKKNKSQKSGENIVVQITLFVPYAVIRAEVEGSTVEEGVDLCVDKLKRQIDKYKSKRNRYDKGGKWIPSSTLEGISATQGTEDVELFSKVKTVYVEPLYEEEAILKLELVDHNFYVFLNIDTERYNLVYRKDDGSYGLLDFVVKG